MFTWLPFLVIGLNFLAEASLVFLIKSNPRLSRIIAMWSITLITLPLGVLLVNYFCLCSALVAFFALFRLVNVGRVAVGQMNSNELYSRYLRTFIVLWILSGLALLSVLLNLSWNELFSLVVLSLIASIILLINTALSMYKWRTPKHMPALKSVPTVSICIPARNETQDLPGCIESMLSSTYQKLEILVLDDCSHDKTPAIIKKYAHEGVRFISGDQPSNNWVPKNNAMNRLFEESTGDIVIFAGVDARFEPETVLQLVQILDSTTDMLSVLPFRSRNRESSMFVQPLRYWWELCVPRLLTKRPSVLSSVWAIKRKSFNLIGGFNSSKRSVQPEAHFAKKFRNGYKFILSSAKLGITSGKLPREQLDTAFRIRYPQAKRRPESAAILLLAEFTIFIVPVVGILRGLNSNDSILTLSIFSLTFLSITNVMVSRLTVSKSWLLGLFNVIPLAVIDMFIILRSMLAYEFGTVDWKERNICLPILQAESHLPKLE